MRKFKRQCTLMAVMCLMVVTAGCEKEKTKDTGSEVVDSVINSVKIDDKTAVDSEDAEKGADSGADKGADKGADSGGGVNVLNGDTGIVIDNTVGVVKDNSYIPQFLCDNELIDSREQTVIGGVSMTVPAYTVMDGGIKYMLNRPDKLWVVFTYGEDIDKEVKLENVIELTEESFIQAIENNIDKLYNYSKLNITDTVEIELNGIRTLRFTGSVKVTKGKGDKAKHKSYYVCGYSFIKDKTPVTIFGVANKETKTGKDTVIVDYIKEVTHNLDEMMRTIKIAE